MALGFELEGPVKKESRLLGFGGSGGGGSDMTRRGKGEEAMGIRLDTIYGRTAGESRL